MRRAFAIFVTLGLVPIGAASVFASGSASALAADAPVVTRQPELVLTNDFFQSVSFHAEATGTPDPTVRWQWSRNRTGPWTDIAGATDPTLEGVTTARLDEPFAYGHAFRAVFTNSNGVTESVPARLVRRESWMKDLGDDIADIPITELTIPGTHDMGTYGLVNGSFGSGDSNAPCNFMSPSPLPPYPQCVNYGKAQSTIDGGAQLKEGIRYFDLRVCDGFGVQFVTCHGLEGAPLDEILTQTREFAESHPEEIVILDLNHHFDLNTDDEAELIEETFARPDGSSLLIPPPYCDPTDWNAGICTDQLTLRTIREEGLGNVIANMQSDQDDTDIGPALDIHFYGRHPRLWGYWPIRSHFGADSDVSTVRDSVVDSLTHRETTNTHQLFVEFLQTTPGAGYILTHPGGSLWDMAGQSNPIIGPAVLQCESTSRAPCFGQRRPENLNILAINFWERTGYVASITVAEGQACLANEASCPISSEQTSAMVCVDFIVNACFYPVLFDFVSDVVKLNEEARTPPVVQVATDRQPATTGWYNATTLGGQGQTLPVSVRARDYRYPTGLTNLSCANSAGSTPAITSNVPTSDAATTGTMALGDGSWLLQCSASDGADQGLHGFGNTGAGPGSTSSGTFLVDTSPPVITCPNAAYTLRQPVTALTASVTDATSGPAAPAVSGAISTAQVGTFSVELKTSDLAGNTAAQTCSYTVSYGIVLRYDTAQVGTSGATVPIKVELVDWNGVNLSSSNITVTAVAVVNSTTGQSFVPKSPGGANPTFTFAATPKRGYQYTLKTTGYPAGSYTLDFIATGDPLIHHAPFVLR